VNKVPVVTGLHDVKCKWKSGSWVSCNGMVSIPNIKILTNLFYCISL
jgi:hypothetical protein